MELAPGMVEALLSVLADCGVGVFVGDGRRLVDANQAMCRLFARDRDVLLSAEPTAFLVPADRTLMTERGTDWSGDVAVREVDIERPNGDRVAVAIASAAVGDRRVGVVLDLSTASETAMELELLRGLAKNSPAGVMVWEGAGVVRGVDMRLRWASEPALAMLGSDRSKAVGRRLGDLLPFIEPGLADRALDLCGTTRVEAIGEVRLPSPEGSPPILERTLIGLPGGLVAVRIQDVTAAHEAEERRYALLRRLIDRSDEQRRRLAMDLHDDAIQRAAASALLLEGLAKRPDVPDRAQRLEAAGTAVRDVVAALRQLVFELSPPELEETGVDTAIRSAVDHLFADTSVDVRVDTEGTGLHELSDRVQLTAFRIAVEALTNVRKHAQATHVRVSLEAVQDRLVLVVRDDGVGVEGDVGRPGHLGMRSMLERAASIGGSCTVTSAPPAGVEVRAVLPLGPDDAPTEPDPLPPTLEQAVWSATGVLRRELQDATAALTDARSDARSTRDRLEGLLTFSAALLGASSTGDGGAVRWAQLASDLSNAHAIVHLLAGEGAALTCVAADPEGEGLAAMAEALVVEPGHAGLALDSGTPFLINDVTPDAGGSIGHAIVAPMFAGGRPVGTLTLLRIDPGHPFDDDDVDLAAWMATQIGFASASTAT